MKSLRWTHLLSILIAGLSLFFWLTPRLIKSETKETMKDLTFVVPNFPKAVSLDIQESEFLYNAMVIGNLVSNLIVPNTDGTFSPGIAESWRRDEDKWIFKIRRGHSCEDGEPITPEGFRRSLMRAFRLMARKRDVPVFNQILGFQEFLAGDENRLGLKTTDDELIFEFDTIPERGFIEYLAFPSLGYACEANYNGDEWANPNAFISSGAFRLKEMVQGERVVFERREGWYRDHQVRTVTLLAAPHTDVPDSAMTTIITGADIPSEKTGFVLIKEIPQSVGSVNIEPYRDLADRQLRQILADKIAEIRDRTSFENPLATKTSFFFSGHSSEVKRRETKESRLRPRQPLRMLAFPEVTLTAPRRFMEAITVQALEELGWEYTLERPVERTMKMIASKDYDLKQFVAEVGSAVEEWVVSMHFCGALGGHYPDPGGKICSLAKDHKRSRYSDDVFATSFNQLLYIEASVVPVFSSGSAWLVSEDIDHAITPVKSLPRFDEVVFR